MRLTLPVAVSWAVLLLALVSAKDGKPKGCDPNAKGAQLENQQRAAMKDFAHLLVIKGDPLAAFDKYVPG